MVSIMKYHDGSDSEVFPPCCKLVLFLPVCLGGRGSSRKTKKDETSTDGEIVRVHETQDNSADREGWAAKVNRRDASSRANRGEGKE